MPPRPSNARVMLAVLTIALLLAFLAVSGCTPPELSAQGVDTVNEPVELPPAARYNAAALKQSSDDAGRILSLEKSGKVHIAGPAADQVEQRLQMIRSRQAR